MFSPLIWKQKLYFNIFTRKHPDNCGIKIPGFTKGEKDPRHCLDTRSHLMHILFFFIWYFPKDFPCQIQLQWTFWEETVGIPLPSSKLHGYVRGRWVTSDGREQSTVFRSVSSQKPNVSFTTIEGWNNGTLNCFLQKNCINPRVPWEFLLHALSKRFLAASSDASISGWSILFRSSGVVWEIFRFWSSVVTWQSSFSRASFWLFKFRFSFSNAAILSKASGEDPGSCK